MAKKGGGGINFGSIITSVLMFLLMGGVVFGLAKANNIDGPEDIYDAAKRQSDRVNACWQVWWENCDPDLKPGGSGSNSDSEGVRDGSSESADEKKERVESLEATLASIPLGDPVEVDYNRSDWSHWSDLDGNKCDTRQDILKRDGSNVVMRTDTKTCRVGSGEWIDPYSDQKFTDPGDLDIDHIIPLEYASFHGGAGWDASKKEQFANDPANLLAASAGENRGKGSKGPAEYMPASESYHCTYAQKWIDISSKYQISITKDDQRALSRALETC